MNSLPVVAPAARLRLCLLAVLATAALSACQTIDNMRQKAPDFNLTQHAQFLQSGPDAVAATVRLGASNAPQTCYGQRAYLVPDTPFFQFKLRALAKGDTLDEAGLEEDRVSNVVRRVVCDDAGRFRFDNLPDASWIVLTSLREAKGATGATIGTHVVSKPGQTNVTLTANDLFNK